MNGFDTETVIDLLAQIADINIYYVGITRELVTPATPSCIHK